jgi:hypothetical protein
VDSNDGIFVQEIPQPIVENVYELNDTEQKSVEEILQDLEALNREMSNVNEKLMLAELENFLGKSENSVESIDFKTFAITRLNVSPSVFDNFAKYSGVKLEIFLNEFSDYGSNSVIYNEWNSNHSKYDYNSNTTTTYEKAACGGWRPIRLLGESLACTLAPNVWTCGWAAYDHYQFASDGCWS